MYESLKPYFPNGPTNRTDPIVRHSGGPNSEPIANQYKPQTDYTQGVVENKYEEKEMMDGINYPLIRINNHLLFPEQIISFVLHHDRFMPYMELVFADPDDIIDFSDAPALDNVIVVMLFEILIDVHQPIKMNFYATSTRHIKDTWYIQAEYKNIELEKLQYKQEVFKYPIPGCPAKWCQLPPNRHPTTYEFLHTIADNCGLGFAATQKTRSIKDDKYRILRSQKYKDLAQEHTAFGGLNEMSYFDSWIDPWNSLIMVNVPWVFAEDVYPDELGCTAITGIPTTQYMSNATRVAFGSHRTITNTSKLTGINNLLCDRFERCNDLNTGYHDGITTKYDIFYSDGDPGNPGAFVDKIVNSSVTEASRIGNKNKGKYNFEERKFIGFDNNLLTPCTHQKWRRKEYLKQLRLMRFKAYLPWVNFGLQRGTLINVVLFTRSTTEKSTIRQQRKVIGDTAGDVYKKYQEVFETMDAEESQQTAALDVSTTGIYYIDGIEWEYNEKRKSIQQILYLIKKGPVTQYFDHTLPVRTQKDVSL